MDSVYVDTGLLCRVPPLRNLRINAYLQLPEAYRSLSRLSSAPDAKAFPLYSLQLDLVGAKPVLRHQGYFSFGHLWFSKEKLELCRLPFGFNCSLLPFYY